MWIETSQIYFLCRYSICIWSTWICKKLLLYEDFYTCFIGRDDLDTIANEKLRHLEIIMVVSAILLIRSGTAENFKKRLEIWKFIKKDIALYRNLRYEIMWWIMNLLSRTGRLVSLGAHKISRKLVGFN